METNSTPEQSTVIPITLNSEINDFASSLSYSGQYISQIILSTGTYTPENITTAYSYFLEDANLKEKILERPQINFGTATFGHEAYKNDLTFTNLENVEGVNALAENQKLEFHPNLTVIYGTNGSGKSGYVRLLKRVLYSRASEEILGNVHLQTNTKPIKADFTFKSGSDIQLLKYPDHAKNILFRQFSVFDEKSISVHLNLKNQFEFRPAGLGYFSILISAFREIEAKLSADVISKTSTINYSILFEGESSIRTLIDNLDDKKILENLKKHMPYSEKDKEYSKKLEEKKIALAASKKDKEIADLQEKKKLIEICTANIGAYNKWFTADSLNKLKTAIEIGISTKEIATKEGIENFKSDTIKDIGGKEWKDFIEAAENFSKKQGNAYPTTKDICILCYQPLSDEAKNLINKYWTFITSTAEKNAGDAQQVIDKCISGIDKLTFQLLAEDSILYNWLGTNYSEILKQLVDGINSQKQLAANLVNDLRTNIVTSRAESQIDRSQLDRIVVEIDNKITELAKSNPTDEIDALNKILVYLEHKRKLELHYPQIENLLKDKAWCAQGIKVSKQLSSRKITDKEKLLSAKYFNQAYVDTFNKECIALRADFGVDINHTGSLGTSFKQLRYKNYAPSAVLSVGEQKVISIADFLSEIELSEINKGIVFDDPVSSLDDERKSDIADRLVIESQRRQVIIFTHDLVFVSSLLLSCDTRKIKFDCHWIENSGNNPGVVWLRNTPVFEKSYKSSSKAQEYYLAAKNAAPEERETKIKNGFAALRTSYEALVIFELFSGVVQRFNERISVDSLADVYVDETIKAEILDSFAQCCRYMEGHSHSDKYGYKKPTVENLQEEIQRFDTAKKNLANLKKARKAKLTFNAN